MSKLQVKRDLLEAERCETDKELYEVEKAIHHVKKDIQNLEGEVEWQCNQDEPVYHTTVLHTEQQTDMSALTLDMCMKENATLREIRSLQTYGVAAMTRKPAFTQAWLLGPCFSLSFTTCCTFLFTYLGG